MFVMLSVRTTTSVRERHAETVQKAININQLIRNISNRKHRNPRTAQPSQQPPTEEQQLEQGAQQPVPETTISSRIIRRSKYQNRRSSNTSGGKEDQARSELNNAKPNNINGSSASNSSSSSSSSNSSSDCSTVSCGDTPDIGYQQPRSKTINIERNCNSIRRVTEKIDKTVQLIGTVVPVVSAAKVTGDKTLTKQEQPVTLCTISQPSKYRLPSEIRELSVELAKPQYTEHSGAVKVHTELVLAATVSSTIRSRTAKVATVKSPTPTNTSSIAPPEHPQQQQQQQPSNAASNLNVNQQSDVTDKGRSKFLLPELNNFRKPPTVQVTGVTPFWWHII